MFSKLNTIKTVLVFVLAVVGILFFAGHANAYQKQGIFDTGVYFSSGSNRGMLWTDKTGLSSAKVQKIVLALSNGDAGVNFKLFCANGTLTHFTYSEPTIVTSSNFYTFNFTNNFAENDITYCIVTCHNGTKYCEYPDYVSHLRYLGANFDANTKVIPYGSGYSPVVDLYFEVYTVDDVIIPFQITSPQNNDPAVADTWITVTGTCPTNGTNRIGLSNDCLGFDKINYNIDCASNTFSAPFYYNGLGDKRVIAREASSTSGDCVDYDDKMDFKTLRTIEIIEGYPDDWYFNFDYYDDYDIKIKSPNFDTALTLSAGSQSANFTFQFVYPSSSTLSNLQFIIKQYDPNGNLLNGSYHVKTLSAMSDTQNYAVTLSASSTTPLHYVVQLTENGEMKRQYPFAIYVSDISYTYNSNSVNNKYFFPRLVALLKKKIIFNYYFAFHDGFYNLFNASPVTAIGTALDITFKTMSANKQYNTDIKIFSASDPNVVSFANGLRPYITAFLWLIFALYLVLRVSYLFSGNNSE